MTATIISVVKMRGTNAERLAFGTAGVPDNQEISWDETDTGNSYDLIGTTWKQTKSNGAGLTSEPNLIYLIDDSTTAGYTYFGNAVSGSATSASVWTMSRMENATGNTYPVSGNVLAAWDDRATETYA